MFIQLLIPENQGIKATEFRDLLQARLVEAGERDFIHGPYALPVDYPDPLKGIGQFYIRVHQTRLSSAEFDALIEELNMHVFERARVCHRIS